MKRADPERPDRIDLAETLRWVAQTIHQAHHTGEIHVCPKVTCRAVIDCLERNGLMIR